MYRPEVKGLLDALVICPCTGNTLARLAMGLTDGPVLMAAKAHLRNEKPLLIALACQLPHRKFTLRQNFQQLLTCCWRPSRFTLCLWGRMTR